MYRIEFLPSKAHSCGVTSRFCLLASSLVLLLGLAACKPPAPTLPGGPQELSRDTPRAGRFLIYVVGEGSKSLPLGGGEEASDEDAVAFLEWQSGTGPDAELLLLNGLTPGTPFPGSLTLSQGRRPLVSGGELAADFAGESDGGGPLPRLVPQPAAASSPVRVRELDDTGGQARVDLTAIGPDLSLWNRDVFWQAGGEVRVVDELATHLGKAARVGFVWTLTGHVPVTVTEEPNRTLVETPELTMIFQADVPIRVMTQNTRVPTPALPIASGGAGSVLVPWTGPLTIVRVECSAPVASLKVITRLLLSRKRTP